MQSENNNNSENEGKGKQIQTEAEAGGLRILSCILCFVSGAHANTVQRPVQQQQQE